MEKSTSPLDCFPFLIFQADDVSALLTAAMPPPTVPSCYISQVINTTGSSAESLPSVPSSPCNLSAASSLDNLPGTFSERTVSANGVEGATTSLEKKEGESLNLLVG